MSCHHITPRSEQSVIHRVQAHFRSLFSRSSLHRGDDDTEYFPYVRITHIPTSETHASDTDGEYLVEGFTDYPDGDSDQTTPEFSNHVDMVLFNGTVVHIEQALEFSDGLAFDYYWDLDLASIDALV